MDLEISRRNLLKWAGFLVAGFTLPKAIKAKVLSPQEKPLPRLDSEAHRPALCKLCPALCMLQIRVVNGKPVGVSGMPGHPLSQGAHCPKGGAILQDLYHPDRLRSPIRQRGTKGSAQWEKISWDQAHQILLDKLSHLLKRNRPEALAILAAPIRDIRHKIQKRFAQVFGTPNFWEWNWSLAEGPLDAFRLMHGSSEGLFYDLQNASLIVSFGWDWLQSFPSPVEAQRAFSELRRARPERRVRIVQIEPRLSTTAAKADEWISIRPDTEGFLALGVAYVLMDDNLYDKNFAGRWTSGFEEYRKMILREYSPEKVSEISGVKTKQIVEIARQMTSIKPAIGITQRSSLFTQIAVHSLNALVGSIGVRRGVLSSEAERYQLTLPSAAIPKPRTAPIASLHEIPERILASSQSPIELLWMERVNPVFLSPQGAQWRKALERIGFIVSFSPFIDESSQIADIILPPHHSLEAWQYGFSPTLQGQGIISFAPPVVSPLYDTGDHGDFILGLAKSLGGRIASALPWESFVESLEKAVQKVRAEEIMKKGGWWEYVGESSGVKSTLKTQTGKLALPTGELKPKGRDLPDASHPFHLYIHVPLAFSFGEGAHLPYLHSLAGAHLGEQWETWVEMHPAAAEKLGIRDGQMVWVESPYGKIRARARHYQGIREDTVSLPFGLGHTAMGRYSEGIGANPADLLAGRTDKSGQPIWQAVRVKIYGD
ncbi:MAG: molybdopterin-dependent oxidoreductase [Elusimicrobia bacterium]|nr:molybdopterin-dependent oxidoreductase [Elusimicrobiota bacterium]